VSSELVTLLFTDLVGSTKLLSRAGDKEGQRIFKAHRRLIADAVEQRRGRGLPLP
jgi:class 3 adenylate cyclase